MTLTNAQINSKYESGINRLTLENNRISILDLAKNAQYQGGRILFAPAWLSSWSKEVKSRLIESLIINIPIPPIVLYRETSDYYQIIDGQERLKTISDFYENHLCLNGLEIIPNLNGCNYLSLPMKIKNQINRRYLSLISFAPVNRSVSKDELDNLIITMKKRYAE